MVTVIYDINDTSMSFYKKRRNRLPSNLLIKVTVTLHPVFQLPACPRILYTIHRERQDA